MLEEYDQKVTEQESPVKPEWKPTLKDILKDTNQSALFGKMLENENSQYLAERMVKGDLDEKDIYLLEEKRTRFSIKMEEVESINKNITPEKLKAYARNNPDFEKIIKLIGPEAAVNIYEKNMGEFAVTDPDRFNALSEQTKNYDEYFSGEWKDLDDRITNELSKKKIDSSVFAKALAIEDRHDRIDAIQASVKKGYNWYQKIGNLFTLGDMSNNTARKLEKNKIVVDNAREELKKYQSGIGEMLAYSTSSNELIRGALAKELIGEKVEVFSDKGLNEMGRVPTEEKIQEEWLQYKARNLKKWKDTTPEYQDEMKELFLDSQKKEFQKKLDTKNSGFWGSIFSLFTSVFNGIKKGDLK